ncbi:type II toxin-antitoxin system RelE/ParE family toxin [Stieleria varia]|uniref:type II toxin-antitoxin system RelE/ParE family toxin n=1 Tax=Stieleria varia TaxID=2528005 RepID=UPI0021BC921B|nr:type II toxin-antitoxin system RelE/ParE family toxin [Stieleria varia]
MREKCRLVGKHPDVGDTRPELGEGIRSTYVCSYVIFFRRVEGFLEIVRVIRGDVDEPKI